MKVLVIGMNGLGLMPTTPRKARLLLKAGKAKVVRKIPFTIKLRGGGILRGFVDKYLQMVYP